VEGSLPNTATSTVVSVSVASAFVQATTVGSPQQQATPSGATALDDEVSGYFRSEPLPSTHFRYIPPSPSQPQQPMCPSSHADSTTSFLETDYARSTDRAPARALSRQSRISSRASSRSSRRSAVPDPVVELTKSMFDRMSDDAATRESQARADAVAQRADATAQRAEIRAEMEARMQVELKNAQLQAKIDHLERDAAARALVSLAAVQQPGLTSAQPNAGHTNPTAAPTTTHLSVHLYLHLHLQLRSSTMRSRMIMDRM